MAIVLSFSGSHGVGKTSLVSKISSQYSTNFINNEDYKIFKEINTGLFNIGFSLNRNGFDFDEVIFSQKQAFDLGYNLINYYLNKKNDKRLIITDRSCIDTYLYTKYFVSKMKDVNLYKDVLLDMHNKSIEVMSKIINILVPPFNDFEILTDRMSIEQRDEIWESFTQYFSEYKKTSLVYTAKAQSTEARSIEVLDILSNHIKQYQPNYKVSLIS
jgi:thymidylate kinase